ncbi:FecR family protein [Dyadobacter bucti]|uniref:FecR family protein n=1 Tax=Dyadobacter bucti TaxID=2572203 RepID=UPI0011086D1F|nr:FecR domain-containing protein [Dyadobacter bucti]
MEDIIVKDVLFDYFSGHASPLQKKAIEAWLQDPGNREQYYLWLHEWESAHLQAAASWQDAFHRTRESLSEAPSETLEMISLPAERSWWSSNNHRMVAAAFLVLMLGGLLFGIRDSIMYRTVRATYGQTRQVELNDGSIVTLNANSSLRFPRFGFGDDTRSVELKGEADFQIRHLPGHQRFVVITPDGLNVTVLGTEFTVFARRRKSQVVLRTGQVSLRMNKADQTPSIVMKPGDLVMVDRSGKLTREHNPNPENHSSWKNHRITLERTSLREIAFILQENYGFQVEIKDTALADRTATGSFPARNADEVLDMVTELFDINFTRQNKTIVFKD